MAGKKIGLVIGTNKYKHYDPTMQLNFAEDDATSMKDILLDKYICEFDEVFDLINKTHTEISEQIETILKNANQIDTIVIYFSGHGHYDDLTGELYLLSQNTKPNSLLATAISFDFINRCIKHSSCKTIIIIIDSCYSGAADLNLKGKDDLIEKTLEEASGIGRMILTSSKGSETSKEDKELEHGLFTHYLLEGLKTGAADALGDNDGLISIDDLYDYASKKTRERRPEQTPMKKGAVEGKVIIGKNPEKLKEKEYFEYIDKLVKFHINGRLPDNLFDEAMDILEKNKQIPSILTDTEKLIMSYISRLLADNDNIRVSTYITTVKVLHTEAEKKESVEMEKRKEEEERKEKEKQEKEEHDRLQQLREEESLRRQKEQEKQKTFTNSIGMKFVLIPAGEFMMGSNEYDSEKPVHNVTISKPFYLGVYPVTQREWKAVIGDNPSGFKGDDLPVENISWHDVQEFIKKLNEKENIDKYRLPSEAEWEYAARAGTTTRYSFGDDESKIGEYAWYWENSGNKTHPVGQKQSNPWGLYDMHGNVWEWVQDKYHNGYDGAPIDGSAWEDGGGALRVARGGSWYGTARYCRSANRFDDAPGLRGSNLGFRLLQEL
jgi:formylglycine-generating enzyme required for sulfatase activity